MRGLVRLSTETDRVYTINLGKVLLSPNNRRAKRAINMIREFARHHMGISEVKIDMDVSHIIWSKGIRSPPRKIRVRMRKTDEGNILISKYEAYRTIQSYGRSYRIFTPDGIFDRMLTHMSKPIQCLLKHGSIGSFCQICH